MLKVLIAAGLLCTLFVPLLFPSLHLLYFPAALIYSLYKKPLIKTLWLGFFAGLFLDLLSANIRFGLHAVNYVCVLYFLEKIKRHFFEDSLSTIPLMTFLFSSLSALLQIPLFALLDQPLPLNFKLFAGDVLIMPAADALFAAIVYTLPVWALGKPKRRGQDYFLSE